MVDSQETAKKKYITNGWNVAHQKSSVIFCYGLSRYQQIYYLLCGSNESPALTGRDFKESSSVIIGAFSFFFLVSICSVIFLESQSKY